MSSGRWRRGGTVMGNTLRRYHRTLIPDPEKNLVVIMKDGQIYKNTVRGSAVVILKNCGREVANGSSA